MNRWPAAGLSGGGSRFAVVCRPGIAGRLRGRGVQALGTGRERRLHETGREHRGGRPEWAGDRARAIAGEKDPEAAAENSSSMLATF